MASTVVFSQKNWDIVGNDTRSAVKNFFQYGKLLKDVNHTFVSLIPKITNASNFSDFRLIPVAM